MIQEENSNASAEKSERHRITLSIMATLGLTKVKIVADTINMEKLTNDVNVFLNSFDFNYINSFDINKHPYQFVDQETVLDEIKPATIYHNPESYKQIQKIIVILEDIGQLNNPKDCPFIKNNKLLKLLKQLKTSSNPNNDTKKIERINKKLINIGRKYSKKCDYCSECLHFFEKLDNENNYRFKLNEIWDDKEIFSELYNKVEYLFRHYEICKSEHEIQKKCPLSEVKPLWKLLQKLKRNGSVDNIVDSKKINKEIEKLKIKYEEITEKCESCQCRKIIENEGYSLESYKPLKQPFEEIHAIGLFLNNDHSLNGITYKKDYILLSKDIENNENELILTFVHENSHALLHDIFDAKGFDFNSKKGLNEGFAVAMEYYFAKENNLKFNGNRHGEYLSHEILTLPDKKVNLKELINTLATNGIP